MHALIWWPSKIKAGSISHQPAHIVDLFPAILDATGFEYPKDINGVEHQKLQGSSLLPVMLGRQREDPTFIISGWTERFRMYREGDWKIVRKNDEQWELYNLKDYPIEIFDLSSEIVHKIAEMENNYKTAQESFKAESR